MSLQQVSAKSGDSEVFTFDFDVPETIEEAVDKFGEEVVYSRFKGSLVIDVQQIARNAIKKEGSTPETVQEAVDKWTPGVKARGRTTFEKLIDGLTKMDPEDRANLFAQFGSESE